MTAGRRRERARPWRREGLPALAALATITALLLSASGCAPAPRANVLLIVVDTLRADHLSLAGYGRPTSPRLAEYAQRGTYFDGFHSHSSWTRTSVATLLTSLMPRSHGLVSPADGLPRSLTTLPEVLQEAGYQTFAFVANPQIHPQFGFEQGFDGFFEIYRSDTDENGIGSEDSLASTTDDRVLDKALAVLLEERAVPYFAYIHLLDPHGPYTPDPADAALFVDPAYTGIVRGSLRDFKRIPRLQKNPRELAQFVALYDAEIRGTDRDLGEFLDRLDRAGGLQRTHVIVTADHGEEFLEHGGTGHGRRLYQEQVHIPLLWLGPGIPQGLTVHELGGLIDIVPTLADLLGLAPRGMHMQGESLRPLWERKTPPARRAVLLEEFSGETARVAGRELPFVGRGMIADGRKVLTAPLRLDRTRVENLVVFDLASDPGEQRPRRLSLDSSTWSAEDAAMLARYVQLDRAVTRLAAETADPAALLPDEDLQRLRSLGYLD
jgi:arylsulfatase A-like enzyme